MAARANHWLIAALASAIVVPTYADNVIYVSPSGRDDGEGTAGAPFAALARARDAIRGIKRAGALPDGGVTVEIQAGVYELLEPLELTAEDGGTAKSPVVYRPRPGPKCAWSAARPLQASAP